MTYRRHKRLRRTRHERASLLRCVGEPLKRVGLLIGLDNNRSEEPDRYYDCVD